MRNLLLLLLVFGLSGLAVAQSGTTGSSRGDNEDTGLEAAKRSVENQLIVEEIEDAGFEIDVEEGFDEEWEEDIWVASEADDVDVNRLDPNETARFDMDAEESTEDWTDATWENPELAEEANELAVASSEEGDDLGEMRGEDVAADAAEELGIESEMSLEDEDLAIEDETESIEANWWDESADNWTALLDDEEMDGFADDMDYEEDLDLLEEVYMTY